MALDYTFTCPLPNGVHARPASALEGVARNFAAEVVLLNQRTGRAANAKSILSIVGADIRFSDSCLIKISGPDEEPAMATLGSFLRNTFPHLDEALPQVAPMQGELRLPAVLRDAGVKVRQGTPVVPGIAGGRVVCANGFHIPAGLQVNGVRDVRAEQMKLETALQELIQWYGQRLALVGKGIESQLLVAHRAFARDEEFRQYLLDAIATRRLTVAGATQEAEAHFAGMLLASENVLLRERALDIRDVCSHLLHEVYGGAATEEAIKLTEDSVVLSDSLTPGQFLALDRQHLKGLVLSQAGTTSHTVILARSFGIPTLVGVEDLNRGLKDGQSVVVDADLGVLVTELNDRARRYYELEDQRLTGRRKVLDQHARRAAQTRDGHKVAVAANITASEEAEMAFAAGAEGIGLFRTEMLFFDREAAPDEEEQYHAYRRVIEAAAGRPVLIRTLDIGGDKPLAYLNLPVEENPFLGHRAVRIYPELESLFRSQIRALVRASAHGPVKVMLPMVAIVDEVRWAKKIIADEQARCVCAGQAFDKEMQVGAMIEVTSAAFAMDQLSAELDFFSIGSNDLLQYFMAVDRANTRVAGLYNPFQPAFIRFLKQIVDSAHAHQKWIGLCGEIGAQSAFLPLLVGLGLDEISVATPAIAEVKAGLAHLTLADCRQLFQKVTQCAIADDVTALLDAFAAGHGEPLVAPELVLVDSDATTRAEAIKQAVDLLYVQGRVEKPRLVEEAIWQREAAYSTGFGHGFAIPHCKSRAVQSNALVVLKLRTPVDWGSIDGEPVRVAILLAIRESDSATEHMKVFSKLARQVVHEEFRASIERETDAAALCASLKQSIGL